MWPPLVVLADENGLLNVFDNPKAFYSPNRVKAQLLWFQEGFIEYRFPCHYPCIEENSVQEISFSLELCSEAPGYQDVWPPIFQLLSTKSIVSPIAQPATSAQDEANTHRQRGITAPPNMVF